MAIKIPKRDVRERKTAIAKKEEPKAVAKAHPASEIVMQSRAVVNLRRAANRAEEAVKLLRLQWTNEHKAQIDNAKDLRYAADNEEWVLRQMAVENYVATGSKQTTEGVEVKIYKNPVYDRDVARAWCYAHDICMELNVKEFEKLARSKPDLFEFVTWEEEPKANIATNLHERVAPTLEEAAAAEAVAKSRGLLPHGQPDRGQAPPSPARKTAPKRRKV